MCIEDITGALHRSYQTKLRSGDIYIEDICSGEIYNIESKRSI